MQSHTYLHTLSFNSRVLSLKCSQRLLVVALDAQIHAFDTDTLQHTFSAVTHSVSAALRTVKADACQAWAAAPMALGSAWLAYASNQASQDLPQHILCAAPIYCLVCTIQHILKYSPHACLKYVQCFSIVCILTACTACSTGCPGMQKPASA